MSCLKAECNVYIMRADIFSEPSLRAKALSVISDERRTRLEKYCFEKDKDLSLTAEFLLYQFFYRLQTKAPFEITYRLLRALPARCSVKPIRYPLILWITLIRRL